MATPTKEYNNDTPVTMASEPAVALQCRPAMSTETSNRSSYTVEEAYRLICNELKTIYGINTVVDACHAQNMHD